VPFLGRYKFLLNVIHINICLWLFVFFYGRENRIIACLMNNSQKKDLFSKPTYSNFTVNFDFYMEELLFCKKAL